MDFPKPVSIFMCVLYQHQGEQCHTCRNKFVANYFDGTKAFVKENWELIERGAGLLALRTWLLVSSRLCVVWSKARL